MIDVALSRLAGRKVFFSEEKKQKTFMVLSRDYPAAYAIGIKVFCFFFSKKKCFFCRVDAGRTLKSPHGP
jgi:hypothetical protein